MVLIRYPKPKELARIGRLINDGYFNQALKRLRDFEERGNLTTAVKLSTQILRASVILDLGDYNSAFKIVKDTCRECIELNDISHLIDAQNLKILLLYHFGQIDESISLIEENDALITTFSQNSEQGSAELEEKESLLASIKGNVFWDKGDIDLAFKNINLSLKLRKKIGFQQGIGASIGQMANYYIGYEGNLDEALIYNEKAISIAEKTNFKALFSNCYLRFGLIYLYKGDFPLSLFNYKRSLELSEEMGHKLLMSMALNGMGSLYHSQGKINKALKCHEKCLELKKEMNHHWGKFAILDTLFRLHLVDGKVEKARYCHEAMKGIKGIGNTRIFQYMLSLNNALLLKASPNAGDRFKVKEILEELLEEKIHVEATIRILLNLCDLLLQELGDTNDLNVLIEIQIYINQILEISETQNSFSLMAETLLLQSRLELLKLDLEEAHQFLDRALQITEERALHQINERIMKEQQGLNDQINRLEKLKRTKANISELINLSKVNEQLIYMLRKRFNLMKVAIKKTK